MLEGACIILWEYLSKHRLLPVPEILPFLILGSSKVDEKRQLINFLLSNLLLEGQKLHYTLKEPFDVIAECGKKKIGIHWLPILELIIELKYCLCNGRWSFSSWLLGMLFRPFHNCLLFCYT